MQKVLNLARKIAPTIKFNTSSSSIYYYLRNDAFFKPIFDALDAQEIIYLCFLIQGYKEGRELQDVLQRCQEDLFSFSVLHVSGDRPVESCDNCNGDGSVSCSTCDGEGEVDCPECNGDGQDDEGDDCSYCDGSGKVECDYCNGDKYEICDDCNGTGEQESYSEYSIEQNNYVSIDRDLFRTFEMMEELTEVDESNFGQYVILINSDSGRTDDNDFEDKMGDVVFGEVVRTPDLRKGMFKGIIDDELKDYFD
jgi:hypothetical protein